MKINLVSILSSKQNDIWTGKLLGTFWVDGILCNQVSINRSDEVRFIPVSEMSGYTLFGAK
jgi:hypothetical protein